MKIIAYYISDYGYGHASRSIAIIRRLLEVDATIRIIICTSFSTSFLKQSLSSKRVLFRKINTDIGYYLNKKTIITDNPRIIKEYDLFFLEWSKKIKREHNFIQQNNIKLVISDISPLPFEAAKQLNIPSIGISNFTWYTAYQNIIDEEKLEVMKNAYSYMTRFFLLAGNMEERWECSKKKYAFFARKVDIIEMKKIKEKLNPNEDKNIIYFGLGMKVDNVDVNSFSLWDSENCVFIVSSNMSIKRKNIFVIPEEYTESQNYIAASDLVISKAGWGTVSEAVINQVPLLILNRKGLIEDQNTINYIKKNNLGEIIDWEKFRDYQYKQNRKQNFNTSYVNEVDRIAEDILTLL